MKRILMIFLFACTAVAVTALLQAPAAVPGTLEKLVPTGSLLVLEAADFSALVRDWNTSAEKPLWLKSDNYQVFSRSRLYIRLGEAQEEFAGVAGFSPDMSLVESVAGGESVLAVYDIGKLEFLYITRLATAKAVETALWKKRNDYQPRTAGGIPYFVRVEPSHQRAVAFATTDEYLLLATREDLLAGALTLVARPGTSVKDEGWFSQATAAAGPAGELRMVMNLNALARSPHFRSYWIQNNVSELRKFSAAISDVHRSAGEIREERMLIGPRETAASTLLAGATALVPDTAGFYRAWSTPTAEQAAQMLEQKILAPRQTAARQRSNIAPSVGLGSGETGSEGDLETRIDEAPLGNVGGVFLSPPVRKWLEGVKLQQMVELQSSRAITGGVLVGNEAAVALIAESDWDAEAARTAMAAAIADFWSLSRLGVRWVERKNATGATYHSLDGLAKAAVLARGRILVVTGGSDPNVAIKWPSASSPAPAADGDRFLYTSEFRHSRERANFIRMMRLLEQPEVDEAANRAANIARMRAQQQQPDSDEPETRQPLFFSENLGSLSGALARVASTSIVVRDAPTGVSQTVIYRFAR